MGAPQAARARSVAASLAGLAAGYAVKAQCLNRDWDGVQFRRLCYNDALPLYFGRRLNEKRFPYIDSTPATRAAQQDLEYPGRHRDSISALSRLQSRRRTDSSTRTPSDLP